MYVNIIRCAHLSGVVCLCKVCACKCMRVRLCSTSGYGYVLSFPERDKELRSRRMSCRLHCLGLACVGGIVLSGAFLSSPKRHLHVWQDCSFTCGSDSSKSRSRSIGSAAEAGGANCPLLLSTVSCDAAQCPVDCVLTDWLAWSACSGACSAGTATRTRLLMEVHMEYLHMHEHALVDALNSGCICTCICSDSNKRRGGVCWAG